MADIPAALQEAFQEHQRLADIVFGSAQNEQKKEAMSKIREQTTFYKMFITESSGSKKKTIQEFVLGARMPLLNKTDFSTENGLVFSCCFPPYLEPSAYVASRRLSQISEIVGEIIGWDVISANLSENVVLDPLYDYYFASQQIKSKSEVSKLVYADLHSQISWGKQAFESVSGIPKVQYIYSRSHPAASHIPAALYKQANPDVVWFAEFSDPISRSIDMKEISAPQIFEGSLGFSKNYHEDIEFSVYELADHVIFTNENQFKYMQDYCSDADLKGKLEAKHMILAHPKIDESFCHIVDSKYFMNQKSVNIAYFGVYLHEERSLSAFFELARNPFVELHFFAPMQPDGILGGGGTLRISKEEFLRRIEADESRTHINSSVGNLELLNIASRMDYLYIEDTDFGGGINPYLPSKLADYLSTGTRIIAKIDEGSALSTMDNLSIIKIKEVTNDFLTSLTKNTSTK